MAADIPEAHLDLEDKAQTSSQSNRRGGRSGGGSRGGRSEGREVQVSKALSKLLRHQADNVGIKLDGEGFAPLDKVVSSPSPPPIPISRRGSCDSQVT